VTPRAWLILHDPSSPELRLKLFHLPNVGGSSTPGRRISLEECDSAISIGETLKEIADMDAYRAALNTAREAMAAALPWNRSISAIFGFMLNTNYCHSDLQQNNKKAAILTEFTDYCFSRYCEFKKNLGSVIGEIKDDFQLHC
jgi:hypothetical protein